MNNLKIGKLKNWKFQKLNDWKIEKWFNSKIKRLKKIKECNHWQNSPLHDSKIFQCTYTNPNYKISTSSIISHKLTVQGTQIGIHLH